MAPNSGDRERAAQLIAKSFSEAELKFLRTKPEFLQAFDAVRSLDDAMHVAELGVRLIMKENGMDGPTRFY